MRLRSMATFAGWITLGAYTPALASIPSTNEPRSLGEACRSLRDRWDARYIRDFGVDPVLANHFDCGEKPGVLALAISDLSDVWGFYPRVTRFLKRTYFDPYCDALATADRDTGTIRLCGSFFEDMRENRASTLVHEARHLEPDDPKHVMCEDGRFAGMRGACDIEFHDGKARGSGYNLDVFFMSRALAKSSRNHSLSRSALRSQLNALIPERFNRITREQVIRWRADD
jgi:hypothetical protein